MYTLELTEEELMFIKERCSRKAERLEESHLEDTPCYRLAWQIISKISNTRKMDKLYIKQKYQEGVQAGREATCAELTETFKDMPMWGSVAVLYINQLLEKYNRNIQRY